MEEAKLKAAEDIKDDKVNRNSVQNVRDEGMGNNLKGKATNSSLAEQDLDTFLSGDLDDSDGGPGMFASSVYHMVYNIRSSKCLVLGASN